MRIIGTIAVTLAALSLASSQRYTTDDGNYIDLYSNEYEPIARPVNPTPRSYGSSPSERQQPSGPKPTPVAILKQINRHNEDGSYTYGFEGADGSFKIETKSPNGDVKGKYGFVDDSGKVRVVEYGADKFGFQPSGDGITVAPPTLVDETTSKEALEAQKYQDYDYQQATVRPPPPKSQYITAQPIYHRAQPVAAYQPQYHTSHTQAIIPQSRLHKSQLFAQAEPVQRPSLSSQLQSQLIQSSLYDDQPAYKTGPVQFQPAPVQEPRQPSHQSARAGGPRGILDQLARDYALPQDAAAPLHDISFGYY